VSKRDLGASVRQRLLNQARAQERPFQELLQYYAMERFLYRLSKSKFRESFILKGALLLTAWRAPQSRPTMDIDLLGRTESDLKHIRSVVEELCGIAVEKDGVEFKKDTIEIEKIKEDAEYEGARVRLIATVSNARLTVQIDIGFGDAIVPRPAAIEYPVLLEFPAPQLLAYPRETVVAEKLEAMTILGLLNSRMKDYFDLMLLSRLYEFEGSQLLRAVSATFKRRSTEIESSPVGLTDQFASAPGKAGQWRAFLRRSRFEIDYAELREVVTAVSGFAEPVLSAGAAGHQFACVWKPGGPWSCQQ
jgi:predicted nucleotidyltransferase component of viral defense system